MRSISGILLAVVLSITSSTAFAEGWQSPVSSTDPEGVWQNPAGAYDGNTSTYSSDTSNRAGYGGYLIFNLDHAINCSRLRVNADFGYGIVDAVQIDVCKDGQWTTVLTGVIADASYTEITFPAGQVTQARLRYHYLSSGYYFWVYEVSLFEAPEFVIDPIVVVLPESDSRLISISG